MSRKNYIFSIKFVVLYVDFIGKRIVKYVGMK